MGKLFPSRPYLTSSAGKKIPRCYFRFIMIEANWLESQEFIL